MRDSYSNTCTAFAIVSPCSKCKNQRSEQSAEGKPFCPRRKYRKDLDQYKAENNANADSNLGFLSLTGTEGTDSEGDALRNPVYVDDGKLAIVWVALARDNSGITNEAGKMIVPSILDPSYSQDNTDYIICNPYPFLPMSHESSYRELGALKEGDTVAAFTITNQQSNSTIVNDSNNPNVYNHVPVEGVIVKVDLAYKSPRLSIDTDYVSQGS